MNCYLCSSTYKVNDFGLCLICDLEELQDIYVSKYPPLTALSLDQAKECSGLYINPDGLFHYVMPYGHDACARLMGYRDKTEAVLAGYVRISTGFIVNFNLDMLTDKQITAIEQYLDHRIVPLYEHTSVNGLTTIYR